MYIYIYRERWYHKLQVQLARYWSLFLPVHYLFDLEGIVPEGGGLCFQRQCLQRCVSPLSLMVQEAMTGIDRHCVWEPMPQYPGKWGPISEG